MECNDSDVQAFSSRFTAICLYEYFINLRRYGNQIQTIYQKNVLYYIGNLNKRRKICRLDFLCRLIEALFLLNAAT